MLEVRWILDYLQDAGCRVCRARDDPAVPEDLLDPRPVPDHWHCSGCHTLHRGHVKRLSRARREHESDAPQPVPHVRTETVEGHVLAKPVGAEPLKHPFVGFPLHILAPHPRVVPWEAPLDVEHETLILGDQPLEEVDSTVWALEEWNDTHDAQVVWAVGHLGSLEVENVDRVRHDDAPLDRKSTRLNSSHVA